MEMFDDKLPAAAYKLPAIVYTWFAIAIGVPLLLIGLLVWGFFGLTKHVLIAVDGWGDAGHEITIAARSINQPKWGLLAESEKTIFQARLTLDAVNRAAIHENAQILVLDGYARQLFIDLHSAAGSAQETFRSLSGAANSLAGTADEARTSLQDSKPLLENLSKASAASTDLLGAATNRLNDKRIDDLLTYIRSMAESGSGILQDGKKLSDYGTKQITTPRTMRQKITGRSGDLMDILGWVARHY